MATNDFLPFAGGTGANVLTQAAYLALSTLRANGFAAGTAQSAQLNKVWRQSSIMAAVMAQMISDNTGADVLDDGTTATILANLKAAVGGRLIGVRVFTSSATYTPTPGTQSIIVEGVGGGGASGGTAATSTGQGAAGASGGNGAYGKGRFTSGFSGITVTIGAGGAVGAAGAPGGSGGTTSLGSIFVLPGGIGGAAGAAVPNSSANISGSGAINTGTITGANIAGYLGALSTSGMTISPAIVQNGAAISGPFGSPNTSLGTGTSSGRSSNGYGVGAGGASALASSAAQVGAAGLPGLLIIFEYA